MLTAAAGTAQASAVPVPGASPVAVSSAPGDGRSTGCGHYLGNAPIPVGAVGKPVREVRCLLRRCGYDVPENGIHDVGLGGVLARSQRDHGLHADGIVGHATWAALRACGDAPPA
ncbi:MULTISPECIES: peptidoglycan-binding domain-containing protein [Streptomyces]|uniref:peptidoglycan-binding domain-containing protein n=1 Tax=Streptomyces TaxID=1883 RepID=UPI0016712135|nr:peptidoglycan-binding domain-containing protein [Streptomyces ruber]